MRSFFHFARRKPVPLEDPDLSRLSPEYFPARHSRVSQRLYVRRYHNEFRLRRFRLQQFQFQFQRFVGRLVRLHGHHSSCNCVGRNIRWWRWWWSRWRSLAARGIRFVTSTSNSLDSLQVSVRAFFGAVGVDFNSNNPANVGKAFVWNDRKGVLTVRATAADLDMVAAAVENLNTAPPEINIKAKFAEITQNDSRALGFNWTLGNFNIGPNILASGGTQL